MNYDFAGALQAGVAPSAIVDALKSKGFAGYDFDAARQAGVSDSDIVNALSAKHAAAPQSPGVMENIQAGAAQRVQALGRGIEHAGLPGVGQAIQGAGNYIAPANHQGQSEAFLNLNGEGFNWQNLPGAVAEQSPDFAASAGLRAAGAAGGAMVGGPVGAAVGAFGLPAVYQGLQTFGSIADDRAKNNGRVGPDGRPTPDMTDKLLAIPGAVASGAAEGIGMNIPGVSNIFRGGVRGAATNTARAVGSEFATEGVQSGIEQAGGSLGTDRGLHLDPKQMLGEAILGGASGGAVHAGGHAVGIPANSFGQFRDARRSGEAMRAFQAESAQAEQTAPPGPEGSTAPPAFDALSPLAQQGAAELAALEMYRQRRETEGTAMGRANTSDPSDTFKGVMDDISRNIGDVADLMHRNGDIGTDDIKSLREAISEARRHNRTAGEGGEAVSYFDTLRDKVAGMGLQPEAQQTILQQLRVLDVATENSLKRNAKGFLERHSGLIGAGLGSTVGLMFPGLGVAGGGIGGYAARATLTSGLRGLDRVMGNQLPPLLQNAESIRAFAEKHGLQPGTSAKDLMALRDQLQASRDARTSADSALDTKVEGVTPDRDVGWVHGMATEHGIRPQDITAAVELLYGETAKELLGRETIPRGAMQRITKAVRDLLDTSAPASSNATASGTSPAPASSNATASGTSPAMGQMDRFGNPIRSQSSYDATINASQSAIDAIAQQHADIHPLAVEIGNLRDQAAKAAFLDANLAGMPASQKARAEAVLRPLTTFGPPTATGTPQGATGPSSGSAAPARGTPGINPLGQDMNRRNRAVTGPEALSDGRRFMVKEAAGPRTSRGGLLPAWVSEEAVHDPIPGQGHNGGPALDTANPKARARMEREQTAEKAQARAAELWANTKMSKAEKSILLPSELDALEAGGKAAKRGRNGVDVAENELLPARKKAGMPIITERTPETAKKVSDLMTKEVLYHLSKSGNAVGWYVDKLGTAMNMMTREFPELGSDPHALTTFKTILAITSNGQPVVKNFDITSEMYSKLRENILKGDYTLPTDTTFGGKVAPGMNAAFTAWNEGIKAFGIEKLTEVMATKYPVAVLEKIFQEATGNPGFTLSGEGKKAIVYGASILGPKIGNGFFSNLNGRFDMPTMDRWFMTTINRLTGTIVKRGTPENIEARATKLAPLLAGLDNSPDIMNHIKVAPDVIQAARLGSPTAAMQFAKAMNTVENRQGFPRVGNGKLVDGAKVSAESDAIRKVAKILHAAVSGVRALAPEGPAHRDWLRSIMDNTVANLNKADIPLTHADLQAVIWFPEQQFWQQRLGVGSAKTDADYEDAAVIHLLNKGMESHVTAEYADLGFRPEEIKALIAKRKDLSKKLSKEPAE